MWAGMLVDGAWPTTSFRSGKVGDTILQSSYSVRYRNLILIITYGGIVKRWNVRMSKMIWCIWKAGETEHIWSQITLSHWWLHADSRGLEEVALLTHASTVWASVFAWTFSDVTSGPCSVNCDINIFVCGNSLLHCWNFLLPKAAAQLLEVASITEPEESDSSEICWDCSPRGLDKSFVNFLLWCASLFFLRWASFCSTERAANCSLFFFFFNSSHFFPPEHSEHCQVDVT